MSPHSLPSLQTRFPHMAGEDGEGLERAVARVVCHYLDGLAWVYQ